MEVPETFAPFVVPPGHLCSICSQPMLDPVCTQAGHTYDRECIQTWFHSGRRTNPCDNQVLQSTVVVDNIALRQAVESWLSDLAPFRSSPRERWDALVKRYDWEERSAGNHNHRLADVEPSTPSASLQNSGAGWRVPIGREAAEARFEPGRPYEKDEGVEKDLAKSYESYRKSAEEGSSRAQCDLGYCYAHGRGVAQDRAEAFRWYQKSAEQGNAHGQNNIGVCYEKGLGVSKNLAEAFKWYRKSAEQGYTKGQHNLGWCYANGLGVCKDHAEACKWYRKSAAQGNALAQHNLGIGYEFGYGVCKDLAKAEEWYRKAKDNGKIVDRKITRLQEKVFGKDR